MAFCASCGYSNMCNQNTIQRHIAKFTNNGEDIARFLAETVRGETPGVKACHRMEAMKYIVRLGSTDQPDSEYREDDKFWGLIPTPEELATTPTRHSRAEPVPSKGKNSTTLNRHSREACPRPRSGSGNPEGQTEGGINTPSPSTGEGRDGGENPAHPVSYLDILNFNLAQLVRSETAEGHTIAEFLYQVMTGRDKPFTPDKLKIKPSDRMAASREILRRGYGHFGRRRKLIDDAEDTNDYDTLHTDLAKRLRQYGEQGSHAILFLHDVMRNAYPEEEYTVRHRVSAAQELLRRGWDTNYDSIKQEHLLAYWRDQQDARLSVGQKKQLAGLHAYADEYDTYDTTDYNSIAQQLRQAEDRKATPTRHSRAGGNPEGRGKGSINTPSPSTGEGRDGGGKSLSSPPSMSIPTQEDKNTYNYTKTDPDPEQDCYYEPLSPEDQAIFDYQTLIDSGEYKEGEIEVQPPTEAANHEYEATLKWIRQAAKAEGIPLLPNPLSGTLTHPNIRSP